MQKKNCGEGEEHLLILATFMLFTSTPNKINRQASDRHAGHKRCGLPNKNGQEAATRTATSSTELRSCSSWPW